MGTKNGKRRKPHSTNWDIEEKIRKYQEKFDVLFKHVSSGVAIYKTKNGGEAPERLHVDRVARGDCDYRAAAGDHDAGSSESEETGTACRVPDQIETVGCDLQNVR